MIPINYHHLYYFYRIAELGSISAACKELRLAQPTLSSQLMQLESFLNTKLFDREKKKLALTDDGRLVLSYAHQIFDAGKELMDALSDLSQRGRVRIQIGVSDFIPKSFVESLLTYILKSNPEAFLSVHEGGAEKLIEDLKVHALDLVMTDAPADGARSELQNHLVGRVPVMFCAAPALARRYRRIPEDLDGAPLILPTVQSQVHRSLKEYFIAKKVSPRIIAEIEDVEVVRRLALSGTGIAPLNQFTALHAPSRDPLVVLGKKSKPEIFNTIYLVTKKRKRPNPLVPDILENFRIKI